MDEQIQALAGAVRELVGAVRLLLPAEPRVLMGSEAEVAERLRAAERALEGLSAT